MNQRLASLLTVLTILAATATACGGSDAGEETDEISVGSVPATILSFPLEVAESQGFFDDEGLDVKVINGKTGTEALAAMIGGSTQITYAGPGTVLPAIGQGQGLRILPPYGSPRITIVASEASGVTTLKGLEGKRLAVPTRGSSLELIYRAVFKEFGVDADKVTFVGTGLTAPTVAALLNDQVDSAVLATGTIASLESQGGKVVVVADSKDGTMGQRGEQDVSSLYTTTTEFYENNPEAVGKFCRAMQTAIEWIADEGNADPVIERLASYLALDESAARKVYEAERTSWAMAIDEDLWNANVGFVDESLSVPYSDVVDSGCS